MTKKAPEVKASPGVRRVPNSTQWHYWKKVPTDLKTHSEYAGKQWAFRGSLDTADLREANRRAAQKLIELEAHWERLKQQAYLVPLKELPPGVLKQMADYIRFCVFSADDYRRDSPELAQRLAVLRDLAAKKLTKEQAEAALEVPAGAYLDDYSAGALEAWNLARDTQAGKAVARRNHEAILKDAQAAAQWLGVSYDWSKPEARPHLLTLLEAKRRALEELTQRDKGHVAPTPHEPKPEPSKTPHVVAKGAPVDIIKAPPEAVHLRHVYEDWAQHGRPGRKPYPEKTLGKYRKGLERFEAHTDNPSMGAINRPCGAAFKRALLALDGAQAIPPQAVADTIMNVGTLLNYYAKETGNLEHGLWRNLSARIAPPSTKPPRDEWSKEELQQLFGLPVWRHYELPTAKNAGLDAAYWVPLLGLYTGARVTELAQLRTDDITEEKGVWFLRMAVTEAGQSLKRGDSWRTIPIPQGLLDLGLLDYLQDIKEMSQAWLFPGVKKDAQNNAGGGVSKWFSTMKIAQGFRREVVFHSFRGSLNTELVRLGFGMELRCKFIGQKPEGGVNVTNYSKLKKEDLIPLAAAISFDFLDLPRAYTAPAWYPGWRA